MPEGYGTSGGIEITDAVIERLADEAERGFDPAKLRPHGGEAQRRPAAKIAQVQLPPDLADALAQRAARDHTGPSEVIRRALRQYLEV